MDRADYLFGSLKYFLGGEGKATSTLGKYVVVWKKQPNHDWKAVADIFNTDK